MERVSIGGPGRLELDALRGGESARNLIVFDEAALGR